MLVAGIGAYYLEDLDENTVFRPWNVNNPEKVLLLMKAFFAIFLVFHIICHLFYYLLEIK